MYRYNHVTGGKCVLLTWAMGIKKFFFSSFHLSRTANIIYVHVFRNLYHRSSITKTLSSSPGESSSAAAAVDSSHLSISHAGQGIGSLGRESSNGSASVRTVGMSIGDDRTASMMIVRSTFGFFLSLIIFISSARNISTLKSRCISRTLCILWTLRDCSQNILGSTVKY
ncbi:hypothetical protein BC943DRAFT_322716 [Umbelopsis sp. AD052]|nr:hypothetical protein BC943DRAFT_322716 [Umbelopsis sp. AD052]